MVLFYFSRMAYSTFDKTCNNSHINIHSVSLELLNRAIIGPQIMSVTVISICHEFIHLLIAYKYGKLRGVEKLKFKTRYVCNCDLY